MTDTAGWVLLAGAAVFLFAAFSPSSFVFGMKDKDAQREFLAKHAASWSWGQIPFALGAVISAVGLLALGLEAGCTAITVGGAIAVPVSLPWAHHCRLRARSSDAFLDGALPGWHYRVFAWGTLAALAIVGFGILRSGELPDWTGWFTLGATALFTMAFVAMKDLPPFVFYLVTATIGVVAL